MTTLTQNLAPYCSFVVAHSTASAPNITALTTELKQLFTGTTIADLTMPGSKGLTFEFAFHAVEKKAAAWAGSTTIVDELNHLVAIFQLDNLVLIYVSDNDVKNDLHDLLCSGKLNGWEPVDQRVLVATYIQNQPLKTLWMGGAHRTTSYRPSSKIISGTKLQDAIDPFGDSTFVAGAVRTSTAGISIKRSGLWFKPSNNWLEFAELAATELQKLGNAQAQINVLSSEVHHGLSQMLTKIELAEEAYDIQWAEPDTVTGKTRKLKLERLSSQYQLEIVNPGPFPLSEKFYLRISLGLLSSQFFIEPAMSGGRVSFNCTTVSATPLKDCLDAILDDSTLVKVFYNNGCSIAEATLTRSEVQDRDFTFDFTNFALLLAYNVKQEKPPGNPPPLNNMFTAADVSLFKWVFKEGLNAIGLPQPQAGSCWLYCDDGSGEVADFVHLHTPAGTTPKITLIHVKGAGNNSATRQVAVGPYEVVTAQAMKNLRRMIAREMVVEIRKSVMLHGNGRVWAAPWALGLTSPVGTANAMLTALDAIQSNCEYEVIIVQPHVKQATYNLNPKTTAAKQLRSLLFGAQALTQAAGARLRVFCDI